MASDSTMPTAEEVDNFYIRMDKEAKQGGYFLNTDVNFVKDLIRGLLTNERRYGYRSCPCRLAASDKSIDIDIICPCFYRDADVNEYGACYCALYISPSVLKGEKELGSVPERRPTFEERVKLQKFKTDAQKVKYGPLNLSVPVWRCLVCGYLCGREGPPEICPICKAGKERFERFI